MRKPITLAIAAALAGVGALSIESAAATSMPYKLIAPKGTLAAGRADAELLVDYGGFALYRVATPTIEGAKGTLRANPEADVLQFTAQPFDTQRDGPHPPAPFSLQSAPGPALEIVQFVGPVRNEWLAALSARGIVPVQYVASNGYIVWADEAAQSALAELRRSASWLQYASPFHGFLKVDPRLQRRLSTNAASSEEVDVTVQVYRHAGVAATEQFVESKGILPNAAQAPLGPGAASYAWAPILKFVNLSLRVRVADIPAIAERPDVTFVGETPTFRMMDEKQDIILTGDFTPSPASVDYVQFLIDHGFSQDPDAYPIVDLTDSTIDEGGSGVTVLDTADVKLHVAGDGAQPVRVAYFNNCSSTPDDQVGAIDGHGSLNAGIIVGYDQRAGFPFQDTDGHQLGLGVNPFGRVGSTAIFVPGFDTTACGNSAQGLILANWQNGARISSNSWGANAPPTTYDDTDQAYDAGVRDADPGSSGNQEQIYVFAAANLGPGAATVSSPGAAKNVITVGASENVRPAWTDGCMIDANGADDANDVIFFSSRGPAPGDRAKPELIAPGTHIQSGASNYSGYDGSGVCDKYHPAGQTEFAASSGTSHSTPAVAGIASLAYWWIEQGGAGAAAGKVDEVGGARAPSPALMKAWLIAHPNYLTGVDANDDLPSNNQGYGMPNLADMFGTTPKVLIDQSDVITSTGDVRTYTFGIGDPAEPMRIALAWTDAPGETGTNPQVNDLDLAVTIGGETWLGNQFAHQWSSTGGTPDNRNNYEAVFLPTAVGDDVTITVTAANIAGDATMSGAPSQDFAIVCGNCTRTPSFTMTLAQPALQVCAGSSAATGLNVGQINTFADPVVLDASGNPAGTSATFVPNPVTPPDDATLTVAADASASAGQSTLTIHGQSGAISKTVTLDLGVFDALPAAPIATAPADGSTDVALQPTLTWNASAQGYRYRVEIATDAAFTHVVASTETLDTSWTPGLADTLDSSTHYWWRVIARNACGDSAPLGTAADTLFADGFDPAAVIVGAKTFTTLALPGDCPVGTAPTIVFADGMENGTGAWTHGAASGSVDLWTLGDTPRSGEHAWEASAPNAGAANDAWLVTPSVALPADAASLSLRFWNQQSLKSASGSCQDGAVLDVSTDGGSTWSPIASNLLLTDPYDGAISNAFGNPLGSRQGWCGDPEAYTDSIVDLSAYAGETIKVRFNVGHDRFVHRDGANWAIDDVRVQACAP